MRAKMVLAGIVVLLGGVAPARAGFVTYTFSGTGTGLLGGEFFSNDSFTITVTSNTDQVTPFSFTQNNFVNNGYSITPSTTTFSLGGFFLPGTFISQEKVFVNNSTDIVGLQTPFNSDLLDLQAYPPFDTYNLQSSIGPVTVASPAYLSFFFVQTTVGTLTFFSVSDVSFTASVVPEPASVVMLGMGMLGLVGIGAGARRRTGRRVEVG